MPPRRSNRIRDRKAPRLALVAALAAFSLANALVVWSGLPAEPLTGSSESTWKYEQLRRQVARRGPSDLVLIGSSFTDSGVMPTRIAEHWGTGSQRAPHIFNFGAAGHNALAYPFLAELVLGVDQPARIAFVFTPQALDAANDGMNEWARIVWASPYGRTFTREPRWRGRLARALLDHLPLHSHGEALRRRLFDERSRAHRPRRGAEPETGYQPHPQREPSLFEMDRIHRMSRHWATDARYHDALASAVEITRAAGAEAIFLDAPITPRSEIFIRLPETVLVEYRDTLRRWAQEFGVPLHIPPPGLVGRDDDTDIGHLAPSGAQKYSDWIAGALR